MRISKTPPYTPQWDYISEATMKVVRNEIVRAVSRIETLLLEENTLEENLELLHFAHYGFDLEIGVVEDALRDESDDGDVELLELTG